MFRGNFESLNQYTYMQNCENKKMSQVVNAIRREHIMTSMYRNVFAMYIGTSD